MDTVKSLRLPEDLLRSVRYLARRERLGESPRDLAPGVWVPSRNVRRGHEGCELEYPRRRGQVPRQTGQIVNPGEPSRPVDLQRIEGELGGLLRVEGGNVREPCVEVRFSNASVAAGLSEPFFGGGDRASP